MAAVSSTPLPSPPKASLYVGDLDPQVSEMALLKVFATRASVPIKSVRLCRDSLTGQSLRYAYLNFFSHPDASKAMNALNHTCLYGKPMRIMWSQRNPEVRKAGQGNLFVKNLDPTIDSAVLESSFCEFGTILSAKVVEENGLSKGFGFVQFDSEESAMNALKALDGTLLRGKKIYVSKFMKKTQRQAVCKEPNFTNVYLKNLDEDISEDLLRAKFSEYGKVGSVAIMKDNQGKSKGFAFICFESPDDANKAVACMNGAQLGSKKIFAGKAQKKAERKLLLKQIHEDIYDEEYVKVKDSNVHVKNLNMSIDDTKLRGIFSSCGQIVSAKVMVYGNGVSKGYGYVCFSSPDEAKKAIAILDTTMVLGKPLDVTKAQPTEGSLAKLHPRYSPQVEPIFSSLSGVYAQPGNRSVGFYPPNINTYDHATNSVLRSSEQNSCLTTIPNKQMLMKAMKWTSGLPPQSVSNMPSHKWIRQQQQQQQSPLFAKKADKENFSGKPGAAGEASK